MILKSETYNFHRLDLTRRPGLLSAFTGMLSAIDRNHCPPSPEPTRYLAEFDFRHDTRERLGINDTERADIALAGAKGKRLTYETTHSEA